MLQDPRAIKFENLCLSLSDRTPFGDDLMRHLLHGNVMHPSEAMMRIEILRAKAEENAVYAKAIRRHQKKLGISAIEWRELSYCGHSVWIPDVSTFLSPTKEDVSVMRQSVSRTLTFLDAIAQYFRAWRCSEALSKDGRYCWVEVEWKNVSFDLLLCDWIRVYHLDAIVTCMTQDDGYDRPINRFSISGYDFPPTGDTGDREPAIWVQFNNERPIL